MQGIHQSNSGIISYFKSHSYCLSIITATAFSVIISYALLLKSYGISCSSLPLIDKQVSALASAISTSFLLIEIGGIFFYFTPSKIPLETVPIDTDFDPPFILPQTVTLPKYNRSPKLILKINDAESRPEVPSKVDPLQAFEEGPFKIFCIKLREALINSKSQAKNIEPFLVHLEGINPTLISEHDAFIPGKIPKLMDSMIPSLCSALEMLTLSDSDFLAVQLDCLLKIEEKLKEKDNLGLAALLAFGMTKNFNAISDAGGLEANWDFLNTVYDLVIQRGVYLQAHAKQSTKSIPEGSIGSVLFSKTLWNDNFPAAAMRWFTTEKIKEFFEATTDPTILKNLLDKVFPSCKTNESRNRLNELGLDIVNKLLPYMKAEHIRMLDDPIVMVKGFSARDVPSSCRKALFSDFELEGETIKRSSRVLQDSLFNALNSWILDLSAETLALVILTSSQLERLDLQKVDRQILWELFSVIGCKSIKQWEEKETLMRRLPIPLFKRVLEKLSNSSLALLSETQIQEVDWSKVGRFVVRDIFTSLEDATFLDDPIPKYYNKLGDKTFRILKHLSPSHLKALPVSFLQNENLPIEDLLEHQINDGLFYYDINNLQGLENAKARIRLVHPNNINKVIKKLDGWRIALLSKDQLQRAPLAACEHMQFFKLALAFKMLEKKELKKFFKNLGFEKTQSILGKLTCPLLNSIPLSFFRQKLNISSLESDNINKGLLYYNSDISSWDENDIKIFKKMELRASFLDFREVKKTFLISGQTLALLSPLQLSQLNPKDLGSYAIGDLFKFKVLIQQKLGTDKTKEEMESELFGQFSKPIPFSLASGFPGHLLEKYGSLFK